jgi:hypothetical protein
MAVLMHNAEYGLVGQDLVVTLVCTWAQDERPADLHIIQICYIIADFNY